MVSATEHNNNKSPLVYARLNTAMLGVAMLEDVPREFYALGMFTNSSQKFGQVCEMVKVAM